MLSTPKWILLNNEVRITGCKYQSSKDMSPYSYWLRDGKHKIEQTTPKNHTYLGDSVYKFNDLKIKSFNMTGDFECVIVNIDGHNIVSPKALFSDLKS